MIIKIQNFLIYLDVKETDTESSSKSVQDNLQQQHVFQQIASSSNVSNPVSKNSTNLASQQAAAAAQLMKAVAASGLSAPQTAAQQIVGGASGVSPHMYMTPFQPNFFNSPFLSMTNLQSSQPNQILNISSSGANNITNTKMFGAGNFPSSSANVFNASGVFAPVAATAAANELSPIPSSSIASSSSNFLTQPKPVDQVLLSAQQQTHHKIYELKSTSQAAPSASILSASGVINNAATSNDRSDLNNSSSGGRSSVVGANLLNADSSSPLRPSSAVPLSSGNQRGICI